MTKESPSIDKYTFNDRDDKTIYLGIETNIICANDRLSDFSNFGFPIYFGYIKDMSATLYLGKIVFKNMSGNLVPEYIPSKISESSFDGLNPFWLNEINPNPIKFIPNNKSSNPIYSTNTMDITFTVKADGYKYLKYFYFRSPKNIVLSKEQIISYFSELHKLNSEFIKNYIDSINNNLGIPCCLINRDVYRFSLGITDKYYYPSAEERLIAIEYAFKHPRYKSKIYRFHEFFYEYLVWSLREFLIPYDSARFQEANNLIFNIGAYKKYTENVDRVYADIKNPYFLFKENRDYMELYYPNIYPTKYAVGYIEGYQRFIGYYGSIFLERFEEGFYLDLKELKKYKGFLQYSPNEHIMQYEFFFYSYKPNVYSIFFPSPLCKYYFELKEVENTFVEFYPRIYPRIYPTQNHPPKGWSKEMMKKLDLSLAEEIRRYANPKETTGLWNR